ncbi:MAG: NAD-dependent epimerase/dehydratase family protein [Acidobacteriota bacterium]
MSDVLEVAASPWPGRTVLVTGATGFIGSWLVRRLLDAGADVACLVRDLDPQSELIRSGTVARTTVHHGDLTDYRSIERAVNEFEASVVFHLGAQALVQPAHRSPLPTLEANIMGTANLLEACRVHANLVQATVVASSDKAYGEHQELPYREEMKLAGRHPYEVSKSCGDLLAQAYHTTFGVPVAVARCGNVYGGGDLNWSRIVPGSIRSLHFGQPPVVRSDGSFVRDYVFVEDVVAAYLALAEALLAGKVAGEAFNFGPERPVEVSDLVTRIRLLMGRSDVRPRILGTAVGEIRSQYLSAEKARRVLGWEPRIDLDRGLRETIDWYRAYFTR